MSYEGYNQYLCSEGHYWTEDCYKYDDDIYCIVCYRVEAKPVWSNSVDQTNSEDFGYIDMSQFLIEKEEFEVCNLGHCHLVKVARYRIPTSEETKSSRTFIDCCSGEIFPLSKYDEHFGIK